MTVDFYAKYLNHTEGSFKDQNGSDVRYFRLSCLPAPEYDPLVFPLTEDAYKILDALKPDKFADVLLTLQVYETRNSGVRCRVVDARV